MLEGSIEATPKRLRVTAQLIDAATGAHVWSERYDRPLDDIFAVRMRCANDRGDDRRQ